MTLPFGYYDEGAAMRELERRALSIPDCQEDAEVCGVCGETAAECASLECSWCGKKHDADHDDCAKKKHIDGCQDPAEPCTCKKLLRDFIAASNVRIENMILDEELEAHREGASS